MSPSLAATSAQPLAVKHCGSHPAEGTQNMKKLVPFVQSSHLKLFPLNEFHLLLSSEQVLK